MGLTQHTFDLVTKWGSPMKQKRMLELGDQIIYFGSQYGTYSTPYFKQHFPDLDHVCIDIKPEKFAVDMDLRKPFEKAWNNHFDIVTNAGTTEHVTTDKGFWMAYKNVHDCLKIGGVVIHENPMTGNWKGHGDHYVTEKFYEQMADDMGYDIMELGTHPAMGNTTDGWNVYCVLKKIDDRPFVPFDTFDKYDHHHE
jgi:hypothetical protein